MYKGLKDWSGYYDYRIELVNRISQEKIIHREFSSAFEETVSWGYNRFFKLEDLEKELYWKADEDIIELKFFVKPTNELVQIQELKKYTELLELEKRQLAEENSKHKLELESRRRLDRKDLGIDFSRSSHKQPWGSTTTLINEHMEEHSVDIQEN